MNIKEMNYYMEVVIPRIEHDMATCDDSNKLVELFELYENLLRILAPNDFRAFNMFLELDEDKTSPNRGFYHHRKNHLKEVFDSFNEMEIEDKYDMLLISLAPRVGKTTTSIRFLAWICGRYPEETQLATSYSDNITTSFYIGVMEIVTSDRFKQVFPEARLINQNAKREEIWLKLAKRYPTIMFVPIGGSMTGRSESTRYLYCDDLVSGIEEALSVTRLDNLWQKYTVNAKQRKKDGCKEIHVATRWSVHDPISKLAMENADNPRCKVINIGCYDENGESRFDFAGGFSTQYYKALEKSMDSASFSALYLQEPIEREGILYNNDELRYYFELPNERPDAIIAVCDSKNLGADFVSSPVGYIYGNDVYIDSVVYNSGLPEVTRPLVARQLVDKNVVRCDVELNNGGNYYAEDLDSLVKTYGGKTTFRIFYTSSNKKVKIITYADFVKQRFLFKHKSCYHPQSEYGKFMNDLTRWTQTGNNKHDDAPDCVAMMAQLVQDMESSSIKILNRRQLGL